MSEFFIKHKVSFAFLGDEYKDAYIIFKKVPVKDFEKIRDDMRNTDENETIAHFIQPLLKTYYISASFPEEDFTVDSLDGFDAETVLEVWKQISGQDIRTAIERAQELGVPEVAAGSSPKSPKK